MDPAGAVTPAAVRWSGDQPYSDDYRDIYHAEDGVAEVLRVFLHPSGLPERFARHSDPTFTIGELGFGSALNFAVLATQFLAHAPVHHRLHFVTVERHPFTGTDFHRCAAARRQQLPIYRELAQCYPPLLPGWHRRHFGERITLSVYFGDVHDALRALGRYQRRPVDAWLLDGFAPDRNPEMWRAPLFATMASLSTAGTTVATFTAAGQVRRDLAHAGFRMRRIDQRPHKRHTLAGHFDAARARPDPARRIHVVGAGLAGSATARQLVERGHSVILHEAAQSPTTTLTTTLHVRLSGRADDALARWRTTSYGYATHWHAVHGETAADGVLQFTDGSEGGFTRDRLDAIAQRYVPSGDWVRAVDAGEASAIAGIAIREGGLWFRDGRSVVLPRLCAALRDHARIEYRPGHRGPVEPGAVAEPVIVCTGTSELGEAAHLELRPVWGQLDLVTLATPPSVTVIGEGIVNPGAAADDTDIPLCAVGASYEYQPWDPERATAFNLERLDRWWRRLTGSPPEAAARARWRGVRAVTPDRAPIVGPLVGPDGSPTNVWLNLGHGSGGTMTVPLAAETIASLLSGEVPPMSAEQLQALAPSRFRERALRRSGRRAQPS